jgi:hypothetical protein
MSDLSIAGASSVQSAAVGQRIGEAVLRTINRAVKQQGENALALLEASAVDLPRAPGAPGAILDIVA